MIDRVDTPSWSLGWFMSMAVITGVIYTDLGEVRLLTVALGVMFTAGSLGALYLDPGGGA
jgi:hypothetical protein